MRRAAAYVLVVLAMSLGLVTGCTVGGQGAVETRDVEKEFAFRFYLLGVLGQDPSVAWEMLHPEYKARIRATTMPEAKKLFTEASSRRARTHAPEDLRIDQIEGADKNEYVFLFRASGIEDHLIVVWRDPASSSLAVIRSGFFGDLQ